VQRPGLVSATPSLNPEGLRYNPAKCHRQSFENPFVAVASIDPRSKADVSNKYGGSGLLVSIAQADTLRAHGIVQK